jgi:5-methylcytosine-specific restriction endonuclease McrA
LAEEPRTPKKSTPIRKISKKRQQKILQDKETFKKDKNFYLEIWHASPHTCVECKRKLGKIPNTIYFHHLLPKRNHPQYRHVPENIAIVCPDCHQQVEVNIDKTPIIKRLTEEAEKNCHKWEVEL